MRSDKFDISVIIPAYNAEKTIERAVRSVLDQTHLPKEIVVVDDGSKDDTHNILCKIKNNLEVIHLKLIKQENFGAGAARNMAIIESTGNTIAFLDADDEWLPRKLELSLKYLAEKNNCLVAHNGWIAQNGKEQYLDISSRFKAAESTLFHGLYRRGFISTSSVVVSRKAILEVGGFDESLRTGQDFDLWLKILQNPENSFYIFSEPLVRYYISESGITSHTERRLNNTLKIAHRHAPILKMHPGSSLVSVWFRVLALHWEAIAAFSKTKKKTKIVATICKLPFVLLDQTINLLRPLKTDALESKPANQSNNRNQKTNNNLHAKTNFFLILFWIWLIGILSAYTWQFKPLLIPIINTILALD